MDERVKAIDSAVRNFAGEWAIATAAYDAGVAAERERWKTALWDRAQKLIEADGPMPAADEALRDAADEIGA